MIACSPVDAYHHRELKAQFEINCRTSGIATRGNVVIERASPGAPAIESGNTLHDLRQSRALHFNL